MSGVLATRTISACPSWCDEPAGHRNMDEDGILTDPAVRTHMGRFGKFEISVTEGHSEVALARWRREIGAEKTSEILGLAPTVELVVESGPDYFEGPAELRQLAAGALKAADWLESQE